VLFLFQFRFFFFLLLSQFTSPDLNLFDFLFLAQQVFQLEVIISHELVRSLFLLIELLLFTLHQLVSLAGLNRIPPMPGLQGVIRDQLPALLKILDPIYFLLKPIEPSCFRSHLLNPSLLMNGVDPFTL